MQGAPLIFKLKVELRCIDEQMIKVARLIHHSIEVPFLY